MQAAFLVALAVLVSGLPAVLGQAAGPHRQKQSAPPLTAAEITGTYQEDVRNTLDVQALPGGKIRFHFDGLAVLHAPGGPNMGTADGTISLRHNVAVYTAEGGRGKLTMRFARRHVFISQDGDSADMGFGMSVNAGGLYKKVSSRIPKFDPED